MQSTWLLSNHIRKTYFSSSLILLVSTFHHLFWPHAQWYNRHPGYSRIILAGLALHYMSYHPKYCTLLYCLSCLLDAVDGQAARALGQTSKFGAVLDMVTDRCVACHHRPLWVLIGSHKVHNILPPMLPVISVSNICTGLPISDLIRLREPLHAYVQVSDV